MASEFQRAAWKELRATGKSVIECKRILKYDIEEVRDCEHMMTQHERRIW